MTFQSLAKQFFGNPAAMFLWRLIFYSLELYLLLILITKAAFLVSFTFDNFFTGIIESIFSAVFDNLLTENITDMFRDTDTLNQAGEEIEIPTVWGYVGNYWSIFYDNLVAEPNPLLKVTMIFKLIILFSVVFLMSYHIAGQSLKSLRYKWVILIVLKIIAIFMFLMVGASNYLALIDSGSFFNYGTLFSFNMIRSCFSGQKLLILFIFFTAARDIVLHALTVFKKGGAVE